MAPRVTVVNDSPEFLELVRDIMADERIPTTLIDGDAPDAIDRIKHSRPDVLMIDLRMGSDELHGWDIAQDVRRDSALAEVPILVCSADVMALKAIGGQLAETRNVVTLTKPFSIDHLIETIEQLHAPAH